MGIHDQLPESVLRQIYHILMEECDAPDHWCENFVFLHRQPNFPKEYRFVGRLGFGGKFWRTDGRFYINCYTEDETPLRLEMIERVNKRLADLLSSI
jgi:hypothetical protein